MTSFDAPAGNAADHPSTAMSRNGDAIQGDTGPFLSPSLTGRDRHAPAFEIKFLISESQASRIVELVQGELVLDPHGDPQLGMAYRTTTLYCDTPQLEVFRGVGSFRRRKHRVRRYGHAPWVYLERKNKRQDQVRKKRTTIAAAEVLRLAMALPVEEPEVDLSSPGWPGAWFHRQLIKRQLRPVCRMEYTRTAFVGANEAGGVRLTFDRQLRGILTNDWTLEAFEHGASLFPEQVICEFKFRSTLPTLFKQIVQDVALAPARVSKYRTFLRTAGFASAEIPPDA